ncbi:hypothetical protein P692DRAFT_201810476 [Suillus brevipes Sb2]|nr:hypothetical protein P692DRAFT_201810476 [Suillus brevipes Sb2]
MPPKPNQRQGRSDNGTTFIHVDLQHASGAAKASRRQLQTYTHCPSMRQTSGNGHGAFLYYNVPPSRNAQPPSTPSPPTPPTPLQSSLPPTPPPSPEKVPSPSALTLGHDFVFLHTLQMRLTDLWDAQNSEIWEQCIEFP